MKDKKGNKNLFKAFLFFLLGVSLFVLTYFFPAKTQIIFTYLEDVGSQFAAVIISHNPRTIAQIQSNFVDKPTNTSKKVRILLVPGHEPNYGGTEFEDYKERDMTVDLALDLQKILRRDSHFEVFITRDKENWNPVFADYFKNNWDNIIEWQKVSHQDYLNSVITGFSAEPIPSKVYHNVVKPEIGTRLFGITKWANENNMDIVLHIHFNDYPRKNTSIAGEHNGFTIYVPTAEYSNSATTKAVASGIFNRLKKFNAVSDLKGESDGIVDEPKLIAIGPDNTANAASMLIEYGYIYEPQFENPALRSIALKDMAYETYLGLGDFFDKDFAGKSSHPFDTMVLPYNWSNVLDEQTPSSLDIFALQTAMIADGEYPPEDKTKNECPRTGAIGPCTKDALVSFQEKHGIEGEDGLLELKTLDFLKKNY